MILTFPRHGEVHAKSDHAILSLEHSTALHHIYTQEHTSTHLHPSRTAFLPKSFSAAPVFPSLLCLFLSHHLCFPILPVSRCFCRLPFLVESLSLSHSPFLPRSISISTPLSPSLSLSHRPAGNLIGLPFLRHLFFFSLGWWWTDDRVARYPQHRRIVTSTALFVDRYKQRVGWG